MSQYKFLVKLFKYTRSGGDEESIIFMRFDSSLSPFPIKYVGKEEPGEEGTHHYD
jgi:hypothetical protein